MMKNRTQCASCGNVIRADSTSVSEGESVFCDKVCRANYHKGIRHTSSHSNGPVKSSLTEKQKKSVGKLIEGVASIILGVILTIWSQHHDVFKGYYVIFYGPVVWGVVALSWGAIGLWKSKQAPSPIDKYMK